jgi:hypothetical protein
VGVAAVRGGEEAFSLRRRAPFRPRSVSLAHRRCLRDRLDPRDPFAALERTRDARAAAGRRPAEEGGGAGEDSGRGVLWAFLVYALGDLTARALGQRPTR